MAAEEAEMVSEVPGRRTPDPAEPPLGKEPEGEQVIERAQDVSLARGPEQEGSRWTLPILVGLLVIVLILLVLALT